jgi:hypothetical protein
MRYEVRGGRFQVRGAPGRWCGPQGGGARAEWWMANAGTGDATVGAEEDDVGWCPYSFERRPQHKEGSAEKAMGRPGDLGTPAALRCEGTTRAAERDGSRGECESGEGEMGIGFFLSS